MLWYGYKRFIEKNNAINNYKRQNYKCNLFIKTLSFPILRNGNYFGAKVHLYIPNSWEIVVLKPKILDQTILLFYIFSDTYYFKFSTIRFNLKWDYNPYSHNLSLSNLYVPSYYRIYFTKLTNLFYSFSKLFFTKLKFKGKGYYIYKTYRNTITHQFGHSHRWYIHAYFTTVKFLNKTTVFIFGSSKQDIFKIGHSIKSSKFMNIFTGRGVRFSKQIVYKKTGKVSTYR